MTEALENAFAAIRAEIAAAQSERERYGHIAATIRVNALRLGATDAEAEAMVRGEADFVGFLSKAFEEARK